MECQPDAVNRPSDQQVLCKAWDFKDDEKKFCDNKDNDCDGVTDEFELPGPDSGCVLLGVCGTHAGEIDAWCSEGDWDCVYDAVPGYEPIELTCDGLDNDCDGDVDEDMFWENPETKANKLLNAPCNGVGECTGGTVVCNPESGKAICSSLLTEAITELCDNKDNDCDGQIDNGVNYNGAALTEKCDGLGECGEGTVECGETAGGVPVVTCSTNPNGTAPEDTAELCDGKDNDCDGPKDEDFIEQGLGATCTLGQGECAASGVKECIDLETVGCVAEVGEALAPCDDGDACTIGDSCSGGVDSACSGTAYSCDDELDCTLDACTPEGGCTHTPTPGQCFILGQCYAALADNPLAVCETCSPTDSSTSWTPKAVETVCSDGNSCTDDDACDGGGTCMGVGIVCDDLDPCTMDKCVEQGGSLVCDNSQPTPNACAIGGECFPDGAENPANTCLVCDSAAAADEWSEKAPSKPCNDGDLCTISDTCVDGACAGVAVDCDDGTVCTDDSCDDASGICAHVPADEACDDGDPCTKFSECIDGVCEGGGEVLCNDNNACTLDSCTAFVGCTHEPTLASCDDGDPCTVSDSCEGGGCAGLPKTCDDGNVCTTDSCTKSGDCSNKDNKVACNDDDPCTEADKCSKGTCKGVDLDCDDGLACTNDVCLGGDCFHPNIPDCEEN